GELCLESARRRPRAAGASATPPRSGGRGWRDRKSTRLNSSHGSTSYAVFCLKKKKRGKRPSRESTQVLCAGAWRARSDGARVGDGEAERASRCRKRAEVAGGSRRVGARRHAR